jgi:O-antigen ligase
VLLTAVSLSGRVAKVSISLISALIFIISLLLFVLGFAYTCFSRSLSSIIRSLIWDLSVFLIYALMAINFPLRTAFAVSHRFR